jgi:hypothetical protein
MPGHGSSRRVDAYRERRRVGEQVGQRQPVTITQPDRGQMK